MRFRRLIKSVLVVVLLLGGASIVWSFLSRRSAGESAPSDELLAPSVSQRSTDFEHSEYQLGKIVFRVRSATNTLTGTGVHRLKEVHLVLYDELGAPSDSVSGQEASYETEKKQIDFSGQVQVRLAEGIQVSSNHLRADLRTREIKIDQDFELERGEVRGTGRGMLYEIADRQIRVGRGIRLSLPTSSDDPVRVEATRAWYDLSTNRLKLFGQVRVYGPQYSLRSDQLEAFLTAQTELRKIVTLGNSRFDSGEQSFSGYRIHMVFEPPVKTLRYFEVLGTPDTGTEPHLRAVYEDKANRAFQRLEAEQITAVPVSTSLGDDPLILERFNARTRVLLRSLDSGIEEARADSVSGHFAPGGTLSGLEMRGQVSVTRTAGPSPGKEHLRAARLRLEFNPHQRLERAHAVGAVDVWMNAPSGRRHLFARDSVEASYSAAGQLDWMTSDGDCLLEGFDREGETRLRAPRIKARFHGSLLRSIVAEQGVAFERKEGGRTYHTKSRQLELAYRDGKLRKGFQWGDFQFNSDDPDSGVSLVAERAVFDTESQSITLTGKRPPRLRLAGGSGQESSTTPETVADVFEIERATGKITARGHVKTMLRGTESAAAITAGRMEADPSSDWVHYSDHPRIVESSALISGTRVRLNNSQHIVSVENNVESTFSAGEGRERRQYQVTAKQLILERAQSRAKYEGTVRVKSAEVVFEAPFVEMVFDSAHWDRLREMRGRGGVEVREPKRTAIGDRALYAPLEKKVTVSGENAQVIDDKQGKAFGRQLTFHLGDDRLLIEGSSSTLKP
ncbi:MAG: LPS export ABC transporter periplasmic protein LptC [Acidobacteriota bacterium]